MPAEYAVHIDWNGDGDFGDAREDVTARALDRTSITIQYGRDQTRALAPVSPGELDLELNNDSRDYSPENTSSPLAGLLLPGRAARVQATLSGVTTVLFKGHGDDFQVLPDTDTRSVKISALDLLAKFQAVKVSTDLYFSITTGQAINLVLDAIGWPAADRDIDGGATTIRWYWEEQADGLEALKKIAESEGPSALAYVDYDTGKFVFRDRHHRLTRAASTTSQATFRGVHGVEPVLSPPMVYDQGWKDIINSVTFTVEERDPAPDLVDVFSSDRIYVIADGQTIEVHAGASDPFFAAVTPESGVDYALASGVVVVTLSRTSGQSTTVRIKAAGGPAVIQGLRVRACPVQVTRTILVQAEDSTSIGTPEMPKYGRRSAPGETPKWAGVNDADAIANIILAYRAEPLPTVRIRLISDNDTRLQHQLTRKLSDRVTIAEDETGLNGDFFIDRVEHRILEGGLFLETVFGCEKVPSVPATVFTFDVAGRGFNDGTFGLGGLSDPGNVFRFDVAGQGFDDGVLAY